MTVTSEHLKEILAGQLPGALSEEMLAIVLASPGMVTALERIARGFMQLPREEIKRIALEALSFKSEPPDGR